MRRAAAQWLAQFAKDMKQNMKAAPLPECCRIALEWIAMVWAGFVATMLQLAYFGLAHSLGTVAAADDPLYRVQPVATAWRLTELHRATTGRRTTVAVIDSGVESSHLLLAGKVVGSKSDIELNARQQIFGVVASRSGFRRGQKRTHGRPIGGLALLACRGCCWPTRRPPHR